MGSFLDNLDVALGQAPGTTKNKISQKESRKEQRRATVDYGASLFQEHTANKGVGRAIAQSGNVQKADDVLKQAALEMTTKKSALDTAKGAGRTLEKQGYVLDKSGKTFEDNFFGQFGANAHLGWLKGDQDMAWNEYLSKPTDENRAYMQAIDTLIEEFQHDNRETLADDATLRWISQLFAGYLPQLWGQTKARAVGALVGGGAGSLIPGVGTALGAKAGIAAGSGMYSFQRMRGAAFRTLIELGVDEETARAAANDEAFVSALIEAGDAMFDLATLGSGKLVNTLADGAKSVAKEATQSTTKKALKALGKYGLNIGGEALEEGLQQAVSIANAQRMQDGSIQNGQTLSEQSYLLKQLGRDIARGTVSDPSSLTFSRGGGGAGNLALGAAEVLGRAVTGKDKDARSEILEAAGEGAKIAAMVGGVQTVGYGMANRLLQSGEKNIQTADLGESRQEDGEQLAAPDGLADRQNDVRQEQDGQTATKQAHDPLMRAAMEMQQESGPADDPLLRAAQEMQREPAEATPQPDGPILSPPRLLNEAARSFGKTGQEAFFAVRNADVDDVDYIRAFGTAYQAGLTGAGEDTARRRAGSAMNDYQVEAAYLAGVMDAKASLAKDKEGVARAAVFEKTRTGYATLEGSEAGFVASAYDKGLKSGQKDTLNRVGKALGVKITMGEPSGKGGVNGVIEKGVITISADAESPVMTVLAHEVTHRLQELAPEQYRLYRDYVLNQKDALGTTEVNYTNEQYREFGVLTDTQGAMDEVVANYTERMLENQNLFAEFAREQRSAAQKLFDVVKEAIQKIKAFFAGDKAAQDEAARAQFGADMHTVEQAAALWQKTLDAAQQQVQQAREQQKNATQTGGEARYHLNENFSRAYDQWVSNYPKASVSLLVGRTSAALKSIGVQDRRITWDTGKIRKIKAAHPEMTDSIIKQVPEIIENPVIIMQSKSAMSRVTMFGEIADENGVPVLAILELSPASKGGIELDEFKIASAYGKESSQSLINTSPILYIDPNKKRTEQWLRDNRLQLPFSSTTFGSPSIISKTGDNSNTKYSIKGAPDFTPAKESETDAARFSLKLEQERTMPLIANTSYGTMSQKEGWMALLREAKDGSAIAANRLLNTVMKDDFFEQAGRHFKGAELVPVRYETGGNALPLALARMTAQRTGGSTFEGVFQTGKSGMKDLASTWDRLIHPVTFTLDGQQQDLTGRHFVLVDDVVSSGSTLMSLTQAVEAAGGRVVGYLSLARGRYVTDDLSMKPQTKARIEQEIGSDVVERALSRQLGYDVKLQNLNEKQGKAILQHFTKWISAQKGQESADQTDGGARYSIKYTQDNTPYVEVENDILAGVPKKEWIRAIKDNLRKKFPNGVQVGNNVIEIDKQSIREMTFSKYTQRIMQREPQLYADKLRATDNIDEILKVSHHYINEALFHPRKDNIQEFARGKVLLHIGENEYTAQVVVALRSNGRLILYDLLNLKRETDKDKAGYSNTVNSQKSETGRRAVSSTTSISTPDGKSNTKYSLKSTAAMEREIARLEEKVERLSEQFKKSEGIQINRAVTGQYAGALLSQHSSKYDKKALTDQLVTLFDELSNAGRMQHEDSISFEAFWRDVNKQTRDIAKNILESSIRQENELYESYAELRSYLRNTKLHVPQLLFAELESVGGYAELRKQNFGRLSLSSKDGMSIDQMFSQLSELWPEYFDAQQTTTQADQLLRIVEVLDDLRPIWENPYSAQMDVAVQSLAADILDSFHDMPQAPMTWADRQEARFAKQKSFDRLRRMEMLQKERARRGELAQQVEAKYKTRDERRALRELRAKTERAARRLARKLKHPTDKQHVPAELAQSVGILLDAIQLESGFSFETMQENSLAGEELPFRMITPDGEQTVSYESMEQSTEQGRAALSEVEKALRLKAALEQARDAFRQYGSGFTVNDALLAENGLFEKAVKNANIPFVELTGEQLQVIYEAIRSMEGAVNSANRLFAAGRFEGVREAAQAIIEDNADKEMPTQYAGALGRAQEMLGVDMLAPEAFFHRLGPAGDDIFRALRDAQDEHIVLMNNIAKFTHRAMGAFNVQDLERQTVRVELGDKKTILSRAQLMELYVLSQRKQAHEHLFKGGVELAPVRDGAKLIAEARTLKNATPEQLATAFEQLSEQEIALCKSLQGYLSGELAKVGNQASLAVFNIEKFKEKDYWPIRVSKKELHTNIEGWQAVASIANKGMTKATTPKASNAIRVGSIFDTFSAHCADMATYASYLGAAEDARRILNCELKTESGDKLGNVKETLDIVFGHNKGTDYMEKLLTDVARGMEAKDGGSYTGGMLSAYKASAIGGNLRVVIQQPTAILRALDMIDAKYLATGLAPNDGWNKAKKYAPIAQWKDWGYFDTHTGRQMKDVLFESDSKLEKAKSASMWLAGKADSVSWGLLWNACEAELKDKNPELKPGSTEFYEAAAARFTEIVDHTQVVDGILQRSQAMRKTDTSAKLVTAFMAEPTKQVNMLTTAIYDLRHAKDEQTQQQAQRRLSRTCFSLAVSGVANAAAQSIIDAMRDDDREKKYWQRWLDAFFGELDGTQGGVARAAAFATGNLADAFDPSGYFPVLKDVGSIMAGHDVSRMDMAGIEQVVTAGRTLVKSMESDSKLTKGNALANFLAQASRLYGLPVANIKRDVTAFLDAWFTETDNTLMQHRLDKVLYTVGGNTGRYYDNLYRAYTSDKAAYSIIYRDLLKSGLTEGKIRSAMENRMKKAQGVTTVSELDRRYYTPQEEKVVAPMEQALSSNDWYKSAPQEQKDYVDDKVFEYALTLVELQGEPGRQLEDDEKWISTALEGTIYGVEPWEFILYNAAYDMVKADKDERGKSISGSKQKKVIDELEDMDWLTDEERAWLFETKYQSGKNNPWK